MSESETKVILSHNSTKCHYRETEVDKAFIPMLIHITQHFINIVVVSGAATNRCSQVWGGLLFCQLSDYLDSILTSPMLFIINGYNWLFVVDNGLGSPYICQQGVGGDGFGDRCISHFPFYNISPFVCPSSLRFCCSGFGGVDFGS